MSDVLVIDAASALAALSVTDEAIDEMRHQAMAIEIEDPNDKETFALARKVRMAIRGKRVEVDKTRKELKAPHLNHCKLIETEAQRIIGLLRPLEEHLSRQEDVVTEEEERLKREAWRKRQAELVRRVEALAAVGENRATTVLVATWTDEQFEETLARATAAHEEAEKAKAEQAAKEAQERAEREEEARKAREAQEAEAQRLRAEREALEAERKAQEERDALRQQELDRQQAAIDAAKAAEAAARKAKEDAERKEGEARRAEAERLARQDRIEAARPDVEKLAAYRQAIAEVPEPALANEAAQLSARRIVGEAVDKLSALMEELSS